MKQIGITCIYLFFFALTPFLSMVCADEITLVNGDTLTGTVVQEKNTIISIESEMLGLIEVAKNRIATIIDTTPQEAPSIEWKRKIELGLDIEDGNTEETNMTGAFEINRRHVGKNEATFKGNWQEKSKSGKMSTQKWYTMGRYAYSFGSKRRWYHFTKNELDHDKFGDIEYRTIPATGIGYWFKDEETLKTLAECALGYEHTQYYSTNSNEDAVILIPRLFFEWNFWKSASISEEFTAYPLISDFGEYRFISKLTLSNKFTDRLALNMSLINEYDSLASGDTKKHDVELNTSLSYEF